MNFDITWIARVAHASKEHYVFTSNCICFCIYMCDIVEFFAQFKYIGRTRTTTSTLNVFCSFLRLFTLNRSLSK